MHETEDGCTPESLFTLHPAKRIYPPALHSTEEPATGKLPKFAQVNIGGGAHIAVAVWKF